MNTDIFRKIGLTSNEIKVYLALLEMGSTSAGDLIKKVELHRTCVYDMLERLIEKGLVSYVMISKVKHFEVVELHQLLNYIDQKKDELDDHKKEIESIIPELDMKRKLSKENQEATVFKGKKALKTILEDVLRTKRTFLAYGAEGKFKEFFPIYYHHFHRKRYEIGMSIKIIYAEKVRKARRHEELKRIMIKFLPDEFETPANTWIFGDKVAIVVWSEQPIATVIRSKEVAKAYRTNFKLLWKIAKY
ncbi:TrmB family transcriptional regulator [Nanoarchaeota archaeon]